MIQFQRSQTTQAVPSPAAGAVATQSPGRPVRPVAVSEVAR